MEAQQRLLRELQRLIADIDAVIVLDQVEEEECGVITTHVREQVARLAASRPEKIFWADSRRRIGLFRTVMIKANTAEALQEARPGAFSPDDEESVRHAIGLLRSRNGRPVFVTSGRQGIWISDPEPLLVPAVRVEEPTDPTGAGDSASAGAVLALCSGASLYEAALTANLVASITVQQLATTGTAHPTELGPRLEMWKSQQAG
jgi:sugar/nucleoside kinase (ribokinase family)